MNKEQLQKMKRNRKFIVCVIYLSILSKHYLSLPSTCVLTSVSNCKLATLQVLQSFGSISLTFSLFLGVKGVMELRSYGVKPNV